MASINVSTPPAGRGWNIALWIIQVLLFAAFMLFGAQKLFMAPEALAGMWKTQWPVEMPTLLRTMGVVDFLGGLGLLLPALTRIKPGLTVLAALGCVLLQISAIIFHVSRNEFGGLPLNFILLALVAFVLWGRSKKAPISPK